VIDTGPSFMTQRQESQEAMLQLIQTAPELMSVIGDLVAKNMDWPGAHEISERMKRAMPKELTQEDPNDDAGGEGQDGQDGQQQPSPEEMQQMMQMQEAQAQMEQANQLRQIELATATAKAQQAEADAETAKANAQKAQSDAQAAASKAEMAAIDAQMDPEIRAQSHMLSIMQGHEKHRQSIDLADRAASAKVQTNQPRSAGSRSASDRPRGAQKGKTQ
jgi:hypothetical protein